MNPPGYTLITVVCDAGELVLYQAAGVSDGRLVLLKLPAHPTPTPALLGRLEQEYEIARGLDPTRIARPIATERLGGILALVLEPGPSRTLASLLGSTMDMESFLRIALNLTACLAELHRNELVHKDLKPEHMLMDGDGHVWLTGLGISSRLPRERQALEPPSLVAGTLAYMAPEQTGRMNRSIDFCSDLYALGVTFYQMLTGVLPFAASDPMEWFHCHIARQPVPPNQRVPNLPALLSEIVMKLLSKTAEDRYQSVAGLAADLRRCQAEWASNGRIASFPLGTKDVPDRLLIPEKLYGRKSEINESWRRPGSCLDRAGGRYDVQRVSRHWQRRGITPGQRPDGDKLYRHNGDEWCDLLLLCVCRGQRAAGLRHDEFCVCIVHVVQPTGGLLASGRIKRHHRTGFCRRS